MERYAWALDEEDDAANKAIGEASATTIESATLLSTRLGPAQNEAEPFA